MWVALQGEHGRWGNPHALQAGLPESVFKPEGSPGACWTVHSARILRVDTDGNKKVWLFELPPRHLSDQWIPFLDRNSTISAFKERGGLLHPIGLCHLGASINLCRIVVCKPGSSRLRQNCGPWTLDNILLTQYVWPNGTRLLSSSTSILRLIQMTP